MLKISGSDTKLQKYNEVFKKIKLYSEYCLRALFLFFRSKRLNIDMIFSLIKIFT